MPQPNRLVTGNSRKSMVASAEASLRRQKTDRIDLYWAHHPDGVTPVDENGSVPMIGPRAAGQLDDDLAAARVTLSAQQLTRLDAVSAPPGAPTARSPAHPVA